MKIDGKYRRNYSEKSFWQKIKRHALAAGEEVIFVALKLYYAAKRPETPLWAKAIILSALGYFISPIDAIPDVTPVVGFADDIGVLVAAAATVSVYINKDVVKQAKEKLAEWFDEKDKAA